MLLENDFIYTMGSNSNGQLGISDPTVSRNSPVLVEGMPALKINWIACGGH